MRKPFETQPALFVSSTMLDHPSLHCLDDTEAVLDWTKLESLMDEIYASKTGCLAAYFILSLLFIAYCTVVPIVSLVAFFLTTDVQCADADLIQATPSAQSVRGSLPWLSTK